jgi:XTP/dITP diphosphohydrolase
MKLVFATHNEHKFKEVLSLIPSTITLLSLPMIGCDEDIQETGSTLEENALLKANYVANTYGYSCFADDTGLLVEALNGAPGVYSARYAGKHGDAQANMDKLLQQLLGINNRNARFETVIALNIQDSKHQFVGSVQGSIICEKKGINGFGYDPIFKPDGYDQTFAQLPLTVKNKIGHRGKAIQKLISFLKSI